MIYDDSREGVCPKCGGRVERDYEPCDVDGDSVVYQAECSDCGWTGTDQRAAVFTCYFDDIGD
ncbi:MULTISPECIES: hypothetical protein [unclassified Adlercreutzia]|uniref:hypothetical protein n=1 Tax=unclassified Adlercreutzia TaxID=2636013 RepID=UPI0013EA5D9C|nr:MULTISPECIES: hypothetical protein [unclassified Adlercreutzia]